MEQCTNNIHPLQKGNPLLEAWKKVLEDGRLRHARFLK